MFRSGRKLIGKAARRLWFSALKSSHPQTPEGGHSAANDNESPWCAYTLVPPMKRKKPKGRRHDIW